MSLNDYVVCTASVESIITNKPCCFKLILPAVEENTLIVVKKSFIAFMCKVVNVATRQESKSDRIKTAVEAAEEFLGNI